VQGRINQATTFTPEDEGRYRQDFLAGTVFAAGAGIALPENGPGLPPMESMLSRLRARRQADLGPAPQLKTAFELLGSARAR